MLYHPGDVAQALDVMKYLSGAVMMQVDPSLAPGDIEVDLGSTVDVSAKAPTPTTARDGGRRPDDRRPDDRRPDDTFSGRAAPAPPSPPLPLSPRRAATL